MKYVISKISISSIFNNVTSKFPYLHVEAKTLSISSLILDLLFKQTTTKSEFSDVFLKKITQIRIFLL